MTLETEKTLNNETTRLNDASWERELERRLAVDLDAFLATVGDDAWFFAVEEEEAEAKERKEQTAASATTRMRNRRRFQLLASMVAASALLGVVGWATFDGFVSQKETTNAKTAETASVGSVDDETSLVAWSVEKWSETDRATLWRQVGERWINVDALRGWDERTGDGVKGGDEENVLALSGDVAANEAERADEERKDAGIDVIAWNDALSGEGISLTPWTCDPLFRVATLLQ